MKCMIILAGLCDNPPEICDNCGSLIADKFYIPVEMSDDEYKSAKKKWRGDPFVKMMCCPQCFDIDREISKESN